MAGLVLIMFVVGAGPNWLGGMWGVRDGFGNGVLNLVFWIVGALFQLGTMRILLDFVDGKKPKYESLWKESNSLLTYLVASILVGISVMVGIVLLIIPGIILAVSMGMYGYRILDAKAGILDSIKQSMAITKGQRWHLFGFGLMAVVLNILGALVFGLGLFVTMPITMLSYAYIYRKLSSAMQPTAPAPVAPAVVVPAVEKPAV